LFVGLLIALRQRNHPRFSALIEGVPPKIIARSPQMVLAKFYWNFSKPT